jgi:hypothetical protein
MSSATGELHRAAEDAAGLVHALGPPLGAAEPGRPDGRGDAGADRDHADLHGIGRHAGAGLGARGTGSGDRGGRAGTDGGEEVAPGCRHAMLLRL